MFSAYHTVYTVEALLTTIISVWKQQQHSQNPSLHAPGLLFFCIIVIINGISIISKIYVYKKQSY